MGYYKTSIICMNGHLISGTSNGDNSQNKFCRDCGAETIAKCSKCSTPIRGKYIMDGVVNLSPFNYVPKYCHDCGAPYPWTERALESARILINEDEELSSDEKEQFSNSLPDLMVDSPTPQTTVSIVRFKKYMLKAASWTADGIRDIIVDIASETIKKSLGF
jgi:hypothetical protein